MRVTTLATIFASLILFPSSVLASIDQEQAESVFRQAHTICARDAGSLWGRSLCGPMLLVDPDDRTLAANQRDTGGGLKRSGNIFVGVLPDSVPISDTTVTWSGTRWCELIWPWPMREDDDMRHVTLAHELFHRIQAEELHIKKLEGNNAQLDTLEGRYLMLLEWRALAAALEARTHAARRTAVTDAILFRRERYRLFPNAADNETALESSEGIAEYTGVRLGLRTSAERTRYALRDLSAYVDVPSLVRSFAYATGPAYGLLLDDADRDWRRKFAADQLAERFDQRLGNALHIADPDLGRLNERVAVYDKDRSLRAREVARDQKQEAERTSYRVRLSEDPVLTLPLEKYTYQFKPQSLVPLENLGTVYPTMKLQDAWGELSVENGGVLIRKQPRSASVPVAGFDPVTLQGNGFTLRLNPGWGIKPGIRSGDLTVVQTSASSD